VADRRRPPAWATLLVVGLLLCSAYLLLPDGGPAQHAILLGLQQTSAGLLVGRVVLSRATAPRIWWVLVAGVVTYSAATAVWYAGVAGALTISFPSSVDAGYFLAYGLVAGFLVTVVAGRARQGPVDERAIALLDAVVFTLAVAAVLWATVVAPTGSRGVQPVQQAVALAYPAALAVLMGLAVRLKVGSPSPGREALLLLWLAGELGGNVLYGVTSAQGSFAVGHPMFLGWLVSYAALAALAVHPDLGGLLRPPAASGPPRARRLWPVLLAALVPPVVDLVDGREGVVGALTLLTLLAAVARVRLVSGDLEEQLALTDRLTHTTAQLHHLARHDSLTGLANRAMLIERLGELRHQRRDDDEPHGAVLLLDLDGFKGVNDTLGHAGGDALLVEVGARVRSCVRPSDLIARLGGDEFAVVLVGVAPAAALRAAQRIIEVLRAPVHVEDHLVPIRASLGVRLVAEPASEGVLLRDADMAMYAAKAGGGDRFEVFDAAMQTARIARHQMELDLRDAAERDELRLVFQPIVDLMSLHTVGVEALVRWDHSDRGLLTPAAFIDAAEESGAIVDVGRWVVAEACRSLRRWSEAVALPAGFHVAVNLSRRQLLDADVVDRLETSVLQNGCRPEQLVLEVTETALMADTSTLVARLAALRDRGFVIAMDDFGIGYSSLDQLRVLPIDVLKVDRSFIAGIDTGHEAFSLASAIVKLAAGLGKQTIAEGVETPGQMAHLRAMRIGLAQGYLFARPLTPDDTLARLHEEAAAATRR
jgi:diguanylate cyclase